MQIKFTTRDGVETFKFVSILDLRNLKMAREQ